MSKIKPGSQSNIINALTFNSMDASFNTIYTSWNGQDPL